MRTLTKIELRIVERAFDCIKQHPELGRVYKKDLIPLEYSEDNGLIRRALVRDSYSKRVISCGETPRSYYEAVVIDSELEGKGK